MDLDYEKRKQEHMKRNRNRIFISHRVAKPRWFNNINNLYKVISLIMVILIGMALVSFLLWIISFMPLIFNIIQLQ